MHMHLPGAYVTIPRAYGGPGGHAPFSEAPPTSILRYANWLCSNPHHSSVSLLLLQRYTSYFAALSRQSPVPSSNLHHASVCLLIVVTPMTLLLPPSVVTPQLTALWAKSADVQLHVHDSEPELAAVYL